ncbi:poly(A) RNA polymerase, mitochondrial-like [Contarinia nasturtii]|uniref:poly(A) RNA polymerase, mitochondrial-like n=1 Tax=Contarinia nasturtii TaxID=265458 RepID=UPI0012D387EF|nr:poly(A) RNA polymerase, mitochondrial-like [Contarinia nasturtii]
MLNLHKLFRSSQYASGIFSKKYTTISTNKKIDEAYSNRENFSDLIARRQSEALCSVILEVNTKDICGQVYNYCKQFGETKNAFVYTLKDGRNLMLLEYNQLDAVKEIQQFSGFQVNTVKWPNRILTVRNSKLNPSLSHDAPLQFENAVQVPIANILRNASTFDEQVYLLFKHTRHTDLSIRLKFITALQAQVVINQCLQSFFPNAKLYPFGSTVNGFGRLGCDLDMCLRFDRVGESTNKNSESLLEFRGNNIENDKRDKVKGYQVKCIASLIESLLPGTDKISSASGARVPIVRYFDKNIHSSVDISIDNTDGLPMTEYIYTMGLMDPRISPFIFLVRWWAREFQVTRKYRDNFTNFQLTYMCLSFLKQLKDPLIPTFDDLLQQLGIDESESINNLNKSFIGFDCDRIDFKTENTSTVLELFIQFLEYFESFDFDTQTITLRTTGIIPKPETVSVFLENVLNPSSTNSFAEGVSRRERDAMQIVMRDTLEELQQCNTKPTGTQQNWGLLEILRQLK